MTLFPVIRQWLFLGIANFLPPIRFLSKIRNLFYWLAGITLNQCTIVSPLHIGRGDATSIEIGDGSFINVGVFLHKNIRLGRNVAIGPYVRMTPFQHPLELDENGKRKTTIEPIEVEDNVLIGMGAIILPGVRIGRGAYVAAGAVVTKDVEPFTLVAGVPAKFIKKIKNNEQN